MVIHFAEKCQAVIKYRRSQRLTSTSQFGKYALQRKLAEGGMAEVFLAKQTGMEGFEKLVVVKRILPQLCSDDSFVKMFLNEARVAARLNHPNVVQIFDLGKLGEQYFIAMEYVHGEDLRAGHPRGHRRRQAAARGPRLPHHRRHARRAALRAHARRRRRQAARPRAPRRLAAERARHLRRQRQARRLRHRQGDARGRRGADAGGPAQGQVRVHVAGAGARPAGRRARRRLLRRRALVGADDLAAPLQAADRHGDADGGGRGAGARAAHRRAGAAARARPADR